MDLKKWVKRIKYRNQYKIIKKYNASGNFISYDCIVNENTILEGRNKVTSANVLSSQIGFGTYIGSGFLPHCKIGRFCSISYNVSVEPSTHALDFVSTYPGFYNDKYFPYNAWGGVNMYLKTKDGYYCEIGNDVWIGKNVLIKGGITIGDGAIIGMGAVVTKDVPPYSIVGGVPSKIIRKRFSQTEIDDLLKIKWWNWDSNDIVNRREDFVKPGYFIEKYRI